METQVFTTKLEIETCIQCGVKYGMDAEFRRMRKEDHKLFYCPAGHGQHYTGKSEAEKLKEQTQALQEQLRSKQETLDWYAQRNTNLHTELTKQKYSNRALKAAKTKIMNRVKNGVCPCCNRTFQNLQNHFITVHPELLSHEDTTGTKRSH